MLALVITCGIGVCFAESTDYTTPYNAVLNYLHGSAPVFGSVGGEWKVFALARSGKYDLNSSYFTNYYQLIENYVASVGSNVLNSNKSTENSRVIIAVTAIGRDARSIAGYDLTSPIKDLNFDKKQGVNGVIYALLALDARQGYSTAAERQPLVDFILGREISGGGWALSGTNPDPDITAAAITALAPYSSASAAINRAVAKLSSMQRDDGGFETMATSNSESCSQVITALSTIGINADTDSRFIKNGNSVLSALCSFFTGGGFAHLPGGSVNAMSSEQAAYALCAYDRYRNGRNDLYNMNDAVPQPTATPTPKPTATPTPKPTATPTPKPTATPTPKPTVTPTAATTGTPTASPTAAATAAATEQVTTAPTAEPTAEVSPTPSAAATESITEEPTAEPNDTEVPATAEPNETTVPDDTAEATDEAPVQTEAADDKQASNDAASATELITESTEETGKEQEDHTQKSSLPLVLAIAGGAVLIGAAATIIIKKRSKK